MVFRESMRLYPPAWGLARKTLEPHEIAGYEIPRGGIVLANPYLVQRDPRWFANPERFDPERWEREDGEEARPKFAYFPFGGGPRRCIGEGFAWMEGVLLLATLAQRWQMRLAEGQRITWHHSCRRLIELAAGLAARQPHRAFADQRCGLRPRLGEARAPEPDIDAEAIALFAHDLTQGRPRRRSCERSSGSRSASAANGLSGDASRSRFGFLCSPPGMRQRAGAPCSGSAAAICE